MPKQGQSVESCILTEMKKKKGDTVAVGDILFSYETDKASFEEEAQVAGTVLDVFFDDGDEIPVLTNVMVIGNEGESTAEFRPGGEAAAPAAETPVAAAAAPAATPAIAAAAATAVKPATTEGTSPVSPRARALAEKEALRQGDFDKFLALVRESGRSSAMYLQNIIPTGSTAAQELMVTIALCQALLGGRGAVRVHGGGFAGTIQAYVPFSLLPSFISFMEQTLFTGCCHVLDVRQEGCLRVI